MSSILVAIEEKMTDLHQKERQLARFIVDRASEVTRMSIVELAERSRTSTATVSRFCKTFRFQSFGDFKMKLASELASHSATSASYQDIVADKEMHEIVSAVKENHIRSITETALLLDADTLKKAVRVLQQARQIDIYGVATSGIVAQDLYQKLVRIGKRTNMFTDSHMQITSAATLAEGDAVLAISYSGETPEIIDALRCAKERGATVISLTKYGPNKLASLSHIQLFTSTLEAGIRRGDMASRIAQLYVVDILFTGLLSTSFDEYVPKLEESFQLVAQYRKQTKGR